MKNLVTFSRRKFIKYVTLVVSGLSFPPDLYANSGKSVEKIIEKNGFNRQITAVLLDLETNKILESYNEDLKLPLASVAKAVTAVYAIESIGQDHIFTTKLLTDGKISNGLLDGDLYLVGGADPSLTTDDLIKFVDALKAIGVNQISGNFYYSSDIIPEFLTIDSSHLPQESFNPGFSGLNLNKNRVLFSWLKKNKNYELSLMAPSARSKVNAKNLVITGKNQIKTVFQYTLERKNRVEKWTVSKKALQKRGMRWLPVRLSSSYTTSVLHELFARSDILVSAPQMIKNKIPDLTLLYIHKSKSLKSISKEMLDNSSNVTAEIIGVYVANSWGLPTPRISSSGTIMTKWFDFVTRTAGSIFFNHSGLTVKSRVSSSDFVKFLSRNETKEVLVPLLKERRVYGNQEKKIRNSGITVIAKTGTMDFNRGLAGYIIKNGLPRAVFAIFSADINKKKEMEKYQQTNPAERKAWLNKARNVENNILASWTKHYI